MSDLLMPDGSSQCLDNNCSNMECGVLWAPLVQHRSPSNILGAILISVFTLSLLYLTITAKINRYRASQSHYINNDQKTVLTSTYDGLLSLACIWALLSWMWFVLASMMWVPNGKEYLGSLLIVTHSLIQSLKIFLHTFTFVYLCSSQIGLYTLQRALTVAVVWSFVYGVAGLMAFNMETYWNYFPYVRLASLLLHLCLYLFLLFRHHSRGPVALILPVRSRRSSVGASKRGSRSAGELAAQEDGTAGDNRGMGEDKPLLQAIKYRRPLYPFAAVAVSYVIVGVVTSCLLVAELSAYTCSLALEAVILYIVFPYAFYRTLQADSRLCQNVSQREEGLNSLVHIGVGQIQLGPVISGGSAGTVVKAVYKGRAVCVKKYVVSCLHVENLRKFEMETSLLGKLNHPNVVKVIGICNDNPYLYLVMEYCAGGDLYSYIHNPVKVLDLRFAVIFMREIASALGYIHSKGIIHRDIKSLNILLDKDMHVQLADFELSHFVGTMRGNQGSEGVTGTLAWLAPETLHPSLPNPSRFVSLLPCCVSDRSEPTLYASDIYSFGVIMYELLTRRDPPLSHASLKHVLHHDLNASFDPSNFEVHRASDGSLVPPRLRALLLQCVQIAPDKRPSFAYILRDLEDISTALDNP